MIVQSKHSVNDYPYQEEEEEKVSKLFKDSADLNLYWACCHGNRVTSPVS